ncbi:hypothetical protein P4O66_018695, partial [Electrophorus voltai]
WESQRVRIRPVRSRDKEANNMTTHKRDGETEEKNRDLYKGDMVDLFQKNSPNPISWAFPDGFSSKCRRLGGTNALVNLSVSIHTVEYFILQGSLSLYEFTFLGPFLTEDYSIKPLSHKDTDSTTKERHTEAGPLLVCCRRYKTGLLSEVEVCPQKRSAQPLLDAASTR